MNFKIIDNFISKSECENLINITEKLINNNHETIFYHGCRSEVFSTFKSFKSLLKKNENFNKLNNYFFSQEFFDFACQELNINNSKIELIKYYNLKQKHVLNENRKQICQISDRELVKIYLARKLRSFHSKIKFNPFFNKKKKIELLYGLSKAGNNYRQSIHRDSDSRFIVFLLYLNDASKDSKGGNLDLYYPLEKIKDIENPEINSLKKINSVIPKTGRLILFENDDKAYHGVELMKNYINPRYFIYGAFTFLNSKNPNISNNKIPTEFFLY